MKGKLKYIWCALFVMSVVIMASPSEVKAINPIATAILIKTTGTTSAISTEQIKAIYNRMGRGGVVYWHFKNSPGGLYHKGMSVVKIINKARARGVRTHFKVRGYCYSMCALITSQDSRARPDFRAEFLFHVPQMCHKKCKPITGGVLYRSFMIYWTPYFRTILTKKEYLALAKGKDVIVSAFRLKTRYPFWLQVRR